MYMNIENLLKMSRKEGLLILAYKEGFFLINVVKAILCDTYYISPPYAF